MADNHTKMQTTLCIMQGQNANFELKPCPFCGGADVVARLGKYMWWVECSNEDCRASGGAMSKKVDAIDAWNRRAAND